MTIFNTVQLPAFDGAVKATQPAAPQLSMPDDEAIQVFQQAYERSTEPPQAKERPVELPTATPETLAKVVEENLTLAKELPQPVELPGMPTVTTPVHEGADGTVERPTAPVPEIPVALERPAELPPATPETLAKVVEENLTLEKELPKPVAVLQVVEKPAVAAQPVAVERSVAAERPTELPPATPETLAKVVMENLTLATDLPQPVELPGKLTVTTPVHEGADGTVERPTAPVPEIPVALERPAELPPATPETLAKVVTENLTLEKELPKPVAVLQVAEKPAVAAQPVAVERSVAAERPTELPPATPETLAKVVMENLTLATDLPKPVELPGKLTVTTPVREGADGTVERPTAPVPEIPVALERPAELPPATPETLAKAVAENLTLAKELPKPVEVPGKPTVAAPVRKVAKDADPVPQALPETVAGSVPAVAPAVNVQESAPVAGVAAKVSAEMPRTASSVVIEAASAVADTLLVTPNLMRGDGEIRVQLKPDVLDGAQICIKVMGKSMQVEFASVTDDVARLMTEAQPQLVQRLTEKIPTFEVAVTVLPGNVTGRRLARNGVGHPGGET